MIQQRNVVIGTKVGRLGLFVGALFVIALGLHALDLVVNTTPSMPIGLYRAQPLVNGTVRRGDIIRLCAPAPLAQLGRARGYLMAGSCAGGTAPLLKIVVAVGGDTVVLGDNTIAVNGSRLNAPTSLHDGAHRVIQRIPRGRYVLPQGEMWLWTPYPGSWDSRYFGPLPTSAAIGRANLLLAFQPWRFTEPSFVFAMPGT